MISADYTLATFALPHFYSESKMTVTRTHWPALRGTATSVPHGAMFMGSQGIYLLEESYFLDEPPRGGANRCYQPGAAPRRALTVGVAPVRPGDCGCELLVHWAGDGAPRRSTFQNWLRRSLETVQQNQ